MYIFVYVLFSCFTYAQVVICNTQLQQLQHNTQLQQMQHNTQLQQLQHNTQLQQMQHSAQLQQMQHDADLLQHDTQNASSQRYQQHPLQTDANDLTTATRHISAATRCNTLQHAATRCNTLQHAATCCNTTRCNTVSTILAPSETIANRCNRCRCCNTPHSCCSTLQHHTQQLQHTATWDTNKPSRRYQLQPHPLQTDATDI